MKIASTYLQPYKIQSPLALRLQEQSRRPLAGDMSRDLLVMALNRRLSALQLRPSAPFLSASAGEEHGGPVSGGEVWGWVAVRDFPERSHGLSLSLSLALACLFSPFSSAFLPILAVLCFSFLRWIVSSACASSFLGEFHDASKRFVCTTCTNSGAWKSFNLL